MKEKELKQLYRYEEKEVVYYIDVQLEDYRDAYSEWDYSPFNNRDLDDDLTEYLLECSFEIPFRYNIIINFHLLHQQISATREKRSIEGMYNYFAYKIRKIKNYRMRTLRDTIAFLIIGSVLLISGTITEKYVQNSMVIKLISEGLFIGGWVMIWEMFSSWFFNIKKLTDEIKHFTRLKSTRIIYTYKD
ncbi:hypothetical protein IZY60_14380 [Lutibacter sp. B2]|nr:hypothetical protein [Lutibacter sp. B2]